MARLLGNNKEKRMKYQLWTEDEYRTSAIIGSFESPESAAETARKLVTEANLS